VTALHEEGLQSEGRTIDRHLDWPALSSTRLGLGGKVIRKVTPVTVLYRTFLLEIKRDLSTLWMCSALYMTSHTNSTSLSNECLSNESFAERAAQDRQTICGKGGNPLVTPSTQGSPSPPPLVVNECFLLLESLSNVHVRSLSLTFSSSISSRFQPSAPPCS
jgi:hypothetical protein